VRGVRTRRNGLPANDNKPFENIVYLALFGTDTVIQITPPTTARRPPFAPTPDSARSALRIWLLFVTGVGMLIHIYSTGVHGA